MVTLQLGQLDIPLRQRLLIHDLAWLDLESVLAELGEKLICRIAYSDGTLEMRMPLPEHRQECKLAKINNQNFVSMPTGRLKERIEELCRHCGIEFMAVDEAHSLQTTFLDGDELPNYGEKPDGWQTSGKRVKGGLYRTAQNLYISADCNRAANILRKVATTLGLCLKGVSRSASLRVRLWTHSIIPAL